MKSIPLGWILAALAAFMLLRLWMMKPSAADKAAAKEMINKGALVLDVRSPDEFATRHHPNAVNIPLPDLESRLGELGDKSRPIVAYCLSGARSARAVALLKGAGFTNASNAGGLSDVMR